MSVCPSVRPHGTTRLPRDEFSGKLAFQHILKIFRENSSFIKIDKNNGYCTQKQSTFVILSRSILVRMRNVSEKSVDKKNHAPYVHQFLSENRAVYEPKRKNVVEPGSLQMAMRLMCFAS